MILGGGGRASVSDQHGISRNSSPSRYFRRRVLAKGLATFCRSELGGFASHGRVSDKRRFLRRSCQHETGDCRVHK
jgi:hypothetical protein